MLLYDARIGCKCIGWGGGGGGGEGGGRSKIPIQLLRSIYLAYMYAVV